MPPRVTWMLPVLNGMPYLPQTLASIEAQTYRDFEIILWDNGSTDGTVDEARRWIPSRIPGEVVTGQPLPLGLALAAMVLRCTTEFGARIDADDLNEPTRLQQQVRFLSDHPEVSVVGSQIRLINSAGEDRGPGAAYPLRHAEIVQEMLRCNAMAHPAVMFRCEAVRNVGNYHDFSPVHVEDYDLWLRMAARRFRLANLPEALVKYRIHDASTTQRSIVDGRLNAEVLRRLQESAPALYGCSAETIGKLKSQTLSMPALALLKIARHLRNSDPSGGSTWDSPVFYRAVRGMVPQRDLISRLIVAVVGKGGRRPW